MLIILNDDLLDMIDSEEFVHRIRNEHPPLQVIYALEKSEDKEQIDSILRKKRKTKSDVKKIVNITNNAEGPTFVANIMKSLAEEAIYELKNIQHNKQYLRLLVKALLELPTNSRETGEIKPTKNL